MKSLMMVLVGAALVLPASAVEYFVDAVNGNDGWDGTCSNHVSGTVGPKKTLNAALALADGTPNTVVTALPGVYDEGEYVDPDGQRNRIGILQPNLTLRSLGGKEVTHIVGGHDAGDAHGIGADAVRCVYVAPKLVSSTWSVQVTNVVIEGFTIRDGAVRSSSGLGGGLYCSAPECGGAMVVNCRVMNCSAGKGGALYNICALRSEIIGNYASSAASGAHYGYFAHCAFARNAGQAVLDWCSLAVNCTFTGNATYPFYHGYSLHVYNCLSFGNGNGNGCQSGGSSVYVENSVIAGPYWFPSEPENSVLGDDVAPDEVLSTAFGDWRLRTGNSAEGVGKGSLLNATKKLPLPPGFTHRDINGIAIDTTARIAAGASQEVISPTAAKIVLMQPFELDGHSLASSASSYHYPTETWPTACTLRPITATGSSCYLVYIDGDETELAAGRNYQCYRRPQYDGRVRIIPAQVGADPLVVRFLSASGDLYVDAENGNDDWDGTAAEHEEGTDHGPKLTLQAASDTAAEYAIVHVAPGVYDRGCRAEDWENPPSTNRLFTSKAVGFVATEGPGTAVVKGAPDPATGGMGSGAIRCAWLKGNSFLQGLTLTGGYGTPNGSPSAEYGGGVCCAAGAQSVLADCIVSNNTAYCHPGLYYGFATRTKFVDNVCSTKSLVEYCDVSACTFAGNVFGGTDSSRSVLGNSVHACGCTIDAAAYCTVKSATAVFGSIVDGSGSVTTPTGTSASNLVNGDNLFASKASFDYRLGVGSAAIGALSADDFAANGLYMRMPVDADGSGLLVDGSRLNVGAYHNSPFPLCVIEAVSGAVEITGAVLGTNVVAETREITLTATDAEDRPFLGFEIDGELQPYSGEKSCTLTVSPSGASRLVRVVYDTVWYVDQRNGNDDWTGYTAATAKKTIPAAFSKVLAGDTVKVAEGVYGASEGEMMLHATKVVGTDPTVPSRLVVPEGVKLVAVSGPEKTVIDATGLGHCVMLEADAEIHGFTLTGGRTASGTAEADDNFGGGVLARGSSKSLVEGCVISNNAAAVCGAGFRCTFLNCRIIGNSATVNASVGRESRYWNCLIDGNTGTASAIQYIDGVDSCTIGANNRTASGAAAVSISGRNAYAAAIVNSLVLGRAEPDAATYAYNSAFVSVSASAEKLVGCIVTNAEALAVDDACRPVIGANAAMNLADATRSDASIPRDLDLDGNPRVMNGGRDSGAFEADWRPRYGRDLGAKVRVRTVSAEIVEDDDRTVRIPTGTLDFVLIADGDYRIVLTVAGNGTLNLYAGDELKWSFGIGDHTIPLKQITAGDAFRLEYVPGEDDTGFARIVRIRREVGLTVIVR